MSGNGRKPVKKIPAHATLLLTMKPEVESPFNRICISYNRRGHNAFAVFLLSFFNGICRRAVSAVGVMYAGQSQKQAMPAKKVFINAANVKAALTKRTASEGTTAKRQWKNATRFFLWQRHF